MYDVDRVCLCPSRNTVKTTRWRKEPMEDVNDSRNRLENQAEDYPKETTPANPRGWESEPMVWNRASFILSFILLSSLLRPDQTKPRRRPKKKPRHPPAKGRRETSPRNENKAHPRREKSEKRDFVFSLFSFVICVFLYMFARRNGPRTACGCVWGL